MRLSKVPKKANIHKKCDYMVFDLETTGFPERKGFSNYYDYTETKKYDTARVVQIAYILVDMYGIEKKRVTNIVLPTGFVIPTDMIHGITHEEATKKGISFDIIEKQFAKDLQSVTLLVAHNVIFDKNVFMAELYRQGKYDTLKTFSNLEVFCTAENTKNICNIKIGKYLKLPTLGEAYETLVKKPITIKQHDALNDCQLCGEIYSVLINTK